MGREDDPVGDTWHHYWSSTPDSSYLGVEAYVVAENLREQLPLESNQTVLDFGCGYGYVAEFLSEHVEHVYIWDAVEEVRESAHRRINRTNVSISSPGDQDVDVILANSVIQYMDQQTLGSWLGRWRDQLRSGGYIVLSDVLTTPPSILSETLHWIWLTARNGQFASSIRFARANARRYQAAKDSKPLTVYTPATLAALGSDAGLVMTEESSNYAFQPRRSTFLLRARNEA